MERRAAVTTSDKDEEEMGEPRRNIDPSEIARYLTVRAPGAVYSPPRDRVDTLIRGQEELEEEEVLHHLPGRSVPVPRGGGECHSLLSYLLAALRNPRFYVALGGGLALSLLALFLGKRVLFSSPPPSTPPRNEGDGSPVD